MNALSEFPCLDSPAKCAALWQKYPEKVVGMWATGSPRQNVDVLWRLREELMQQGVPVIFFFNESAVPMLRTILEAKFSTHPGCDEGIYQLDESKLFRLLNFVEVLITNDYCVDYPRSRHIGAKLVCMAHTAKMEFPFLGSHFYDYFVSDNNNPSNFDYNLYPDECKIHRNKNITQLVSGYTKIDLLIEERRKYSYKMKNIIMLFYPIYIFLYAYATY